MKKFVLLFVLILLACGGDDAERNPFLSEVRVNARLDLNLPQYSSLITPGNSLYISSDGSIPIGHRGVFITNTGSGFVAFEASCPNHRPNNCSTMTAISSTTCECSCEGYTYNLFSGQPLDVPEGETRYPMLWYSTTVADNVVIISN